MKVAINKCFGGFGISKQCYDLMVEMGYVLKEPFPNMPEDQAPFWAAKDRSNPIMIKAIETLGKKAWTRYSEIKIVEIPDGAEYEIDDYDGMETLRQPSQVWG